MASESTEQAEYRGEGLAVRAIVGGALMGLANLVPGISGGTMLLAVGIYPQFINGVAEVTTFKLRPRTLLLLGCVVGAAVAAIIALAGVVGTLVIEQRWIMYSLFIGLTLGGVPVIWRMVRPLDGLVIVMAVVGIAAMAALALVDPSGRSAGGGSIAMLLLAGIAGGSAMILPGVSGGYLLLVLGQYLIILTAISDARAAVTSRDWATAAEGLGVFIPVGIGVVIGVVGVSNLVKLLLTRFERATLGFLLGLLLGAVIGLWPFQQGVAPEVGVAFRGDTVAMVDELLVMAETGRVIEPKDYPTERFTPTAIQIAASIGVILAGLLAATLIARLGSSKDDPDEL